MENRLDLLQLTPGLVHIRTHIHVSPQRPQFKVLDVGHKLFKCENVSDVCDVDGYGDGVGGRSKCTTQQQEQQQQLPMQPAVGHKAAQTMPFTDGISNTINY